MSTNGKKLYIAFLVVISLIILVANVFIAIEKGNDATANDAATTNSTKTNNYDRDESTGDDGDESLFEDDDLDDSSTSSFSEEDVEPKSTKLFKKIYIPYAAREKKCAFSGVNSYVKSSGFKYKTVKPSKKESGKITVYAKNGDYVFFSFYDCNGLDVIMSVSYYSKENDCEVSRSNYSSDNAEEYDQLSTHIIGDSEEEVDSIDEQCLFLFDN
ncbi:MAG: hypothetical protein HFG35_02390 [Eubacterium sp.]|nr:hypothetical protein [Eubacterium sp.]